MRTTKSTENYSQSISRLKDAIKTSDCVIIGAGAGLSNAAGYTYSGERFRKYFSDFSAKYKFDDMYSGGFYPYNTEEEFWAYWSRYIYVNRYTDIPTDLYKKLFSIIRDKDYFVITTNVDHCFQRAGFDKRRLFYTQGDFGLFQCSVPCCNETYDNKKIVTEMFSKQKNMKIPKSLIPRCPKCNGQLTLNLRSDDKFVEDEGWHRAAERYENFLRTRSDSKILFLELGVGYNTPVIIKYPFWKMTAQNKDAVYACINANDIEIPPEIRTKSICLKADIKDVIEVIAETEK